MAYTDLADLDPILGRIGRGCGRWASSARYENRASAYRRFQKTPTIESTHGRFLGPCYINH